MSLGEVTNHDYDFSEIDHVALPYAVSSLGRAAYTLFVTPEHEKLHQAVEAEGERLDPQPLQPPIAVVASLVSGEVLPRSERILPPRVGSRRLINLGAALIQFADYVPKLHTTMRISYDAMNELHMAVAVKAKENGPLNYADQLGTALELTEGDVSKALWRLFITSRHYARWLDGKIVQGMPELTVDQKVAQMLQWRESIAACKEPAEGLPQDPNGDTYYTWTHAFAKHMYSLAPSRESRASRTAVKAFHNGTSIMHKVVHTFNKQGVQSDHSVAAMYGNAIGQATVDYARQSYIEVA